MIKLTKKQAILYKKRWKRVELLQAKDFSAIPMSLKFKQLCFLMDSFRSRSIDKEREKEISEVRERWALLRKRMKKGV